MAGFAVTNEFLLSTATVMIGATSALKSLEPGAHSIGLVKNFKLASDPKLIELTQGVLERRRGHHEDRPGPEGQLGDVRVHREEPRLRGRPGREHRLHRVLDQLGGPIDSATLGATAISTTPPT